METKDEIDLWISHFVDLLRTQEGAKQLFNEEVIGLLIGETRQMKLSRENTIFWQKIQHIQKAQKRIKDSFLRRNGFRAAEHRTPLLVEWGKANHEAWLRGEKSRLGDDYVPYSKKLHDLVLRSIQRGEILGITTCHFDHPESKFKISIAHFAGQEVSTGFRRAFRDITTKSFSDRMVINTVCGEWDELWGWSEARNRYILTLQVDIAIMLGIVANRHLMQELTWNLRNDDYAGIIKNLVYCLRMLNLGWRIWGWAERKWLDKPFALTSEGGIGVDFFHRDAHVFCSSLSQLHRSLLSGSVTFDEQLKDSLLTLFDLGIELFFGSIVKRESLLKAYDIECQQTTRRSPHKPQGAEYGYSQV